MPSTREDSIIEQPQTKYPSQVEKSILINEIEYNLNDEERFKERLLT